MIYGHHGEHEATLAIEEISLSTLPAIAMSSPSLGQLVEFLNGLPPPRHELPDVIEWRRKNKRGSGSGASSSKF